MSESKGLCNIEHPLSRKKTLGKAINVFTVQVHSPLTDEIKVLNDRDGERV